jgi:hypothetical protein
VPPFVVAEPSGLEKALGGEWPHVGQFWVSPRRLSVPQSSWV